MAIAELVMPKLGESIMEATVLKWHKQVGDPVKQDETVLDIATDKVDSEVPSTAQGVITEILFNVNDVVPIGTVIARIRTGAEEETAPITQPVTAAPVVVAETPAPEPETPTLIAEAYYAEAEVPYTPPTPPVQEELTLPIELAAKPLVNRFYSPL